MSDLREKFVVGNWKEKIPPGGFEYYVYKLNKFMQTRRSFSMCTPTVVICPGDVFIDSMKRQAKCFQVGAQNVHADLAADRAYTGRSTADALAWAGAKFCIVGHSECRRDFGETEDLIAQKVIELLRCSADLITPIICVGEDDWVREESDEAAELFVRGQVRHILESMPEKLVEWVMIAYEPIWAIGTGKVPTPEQIASMANAIGVELFAHSDDSVDELPPILYGGSVNAGNAAEIADIEGIDGVLVGGASLDGKTFGQIIREYCQ